MQNGILLLDIAFKDLTSSKLLFERELYPQSIFYMQQAVEKSIKQLGIYNGVVKPSELQKDIGHKAEKIFKRVVGQVKHITGDSDTGINNSYNELKQLLKKAGMAEVKEVVIKALEDNMQLELPSAIIELVIEMIIKKQAPDFYEKVARNKQIDEEFRNMKGNFIKYFPAYIKYSYQSCFLYFKIQPSFQQGSLLDKFSSGKDFLILSKEDISRGHIIQ
jgi:hypothetical protein